MYTVYILHSKTFDRYYVGYTNNLARRLSEHNRIKRKFTDAGIPWIVVYTEIFMTKKDAMNREKFTLSSSQGMKGDRVHHLLKWYRRLPMHLKSLLISLCMATRTTRQNNLSQTGSCYRCFKKFSCLTKDRKRLWRISFLLTYWKTIWSKNWHRDSCNVKIWGWPSGWRRPIEDRLNLFRVSRVRILSPPL